MYFSVLTARTSEPETNALYWPRISSGLPVRCEVQPTNDWATQRIKPLPGIALDFSKVNILYRSGKAFPHRVA